MIDYDTESAKKLAKNVFTIEEFFKMRLQKVKFMQNNFLRRKKLLKFTDIAIKSH
jgi:hypothetical protein